MWLFDPGLKWGIYGTARVAFAGVAGPESAEIPGTGAKTGSLESKDAECFRRVIKEIQLGIAAPEHLWRLLRTSTNIPWSTYNCNKASIPGTQSSASFPRSPEARACRREVGKKGREPMCLPWKEKILLSFFSGCPSQGISGGYLHTWRFFSHHLTVPQLGEDKWELPAPPKLWKHSGCVCREHLADLDQNKPCGEGVRWFLC